MEILLLLITGILVIAVPAFFVSELMKKDNEILKWQLAYGELATENELRKLGVMK